MKSLRQVILAVGIIGALAITAPLAAQTAKKGMAKPMAAKKGAAAEHSMTGCLQKDMGNSKFTLTNVEGNGPKTVEIVDVASDVNATAHVGHKVTITGMAVKAAKKGEHDMKVSALKHVSPSCP